MIIKKYACLVNLEPIKWKNIRVNVIYVHQMEYVWDYIKEFSLCLDFGMKIIYQRISTSVIISWHVSLSLIWVIFFLRD